MTDVSAKFKPVAMDRLATLRVSTKLLLPGITFCLVVVLAANYITDHYGSPAILCALLLGIIFPNIPNFLTA